MFCCAGLVAQESFSILGGIGWSKVSGHYSLLDDSYTPSVQVGVAYEKSLGPLYLFNSAVLLNQVEGVEKYEHPIIVGLGFIAAEVPATYRQHLSFLSLPTTLGFRMRQFSLKGGIQPSILLRGRTRHRIDRYVSETYNIDFQLDKKEKTEVRYDLGLVLGLSYKVSEGIELELSYYHGMVNLESESVDEFGRNNHPLQRVRQFIFSTKYMLHKKA